MNRYIQPECLVVELYLEKNVLISGSTEKMSIKNDNWDD